MSIIRQLAKFDRYTKAETDIKIVALSPPTDLTGYYTKAETDVKIVALNL